MINNELYHTLHDQWYEASDHPVAVLRKEGEFKTEWLLQQLKDFSPQQTRVLDIGCGAGFISNQLAQAQFQVTGLDASASSLEVAKRFDSTGSVQYLEGDAHHLPFKDQSFEVVACLDVLEHISDPALAIKEASRVLKPGGVFFFHTMNRNWLSYLIALKGMEWFVRNTPKHLHVYSMFIKPRELKIMCEQAGLQTKAWTGLRPQLNAGFFRMLRTGVVNSEFGFKSTRSRAISYLGSAFKHSR